MNKMNKLEVEQAVIVDFCEKLYGFEPAMALTAVCMVIDTVAEIVEVPSVKLIEDVTPVVAEVNAMREWLEQQGGKGVC